MAVTVSVAGSVTFSRNQSAVAAGLRPFASSVQCPVTNVNGDWMVAIIAWTASDQSTSSKSVSFSVGDDAHNWWEPLGAPNGISPVANVRTEIWVAPAARAANFVLAAPTGTFQEFCMVVYDVNGLLPWYTFTNVASAHASANNLSVSLPAPVAQAINFTGFASNIGAFSGPGAGWTSTSALTTANGFILNPAYQISTGSVTAAWTTLIVTSEATVAGGVLVSGAAPVQSNPYWPATLLELAPGFGPQSAPDQVTWINATSRYLKLDVTQGRQYQLSALQPAQGVVILDNVDGALEPPGTGIFSGIDSGTPVRLRTVWQGGAWQLQFNGNGSTAAPGVSSATGTSGLAVTGNTSVTFSAWMISPQGWPLGSGGVTINGTWYTSAGSSISTYASTAVGLTAGTLTMVTGTFTSPSNAAFASVILSAVGTPASTVIFQAAAVTGSANAKFGMTTAKNSATVSVLGTWVPSILGPPVNTPWMIPFSGFVQAWPQSWDPATFRGLVQATITDAFGYLSANLQPILQQEIENLKPYAYWPLTDPPGTTNATNFALGNSNPLVLTTSKQGTTSGGITVTEAFGSNSGAIFGAQGTVPITSSARVQEQGGMWSQTLSAVGASPAIGYSMTCSDGNFPTLSGNNSVTVVFWFQALGAQPTLYDGALFSFGSTGTSGQILGLTYGGTPIGYTVAGSNTPINSFLSFGSFTQTHVHMAAFVFTNTGYNFYLDDATSPTMNGTWTTPITQFSTISIGGLIGQFVPAGFISAGYVVQAYPGAIGHVAIWGKTLTTAQLNDIYNAGTAGMAGDSSFNRIERLLQSTPYLGRRVILKDQNNYVTQVASCQDIGGQASSISINNVSANTIPGQIWNVPCGDLFYQARQYTFNQPIQWLIGDRPDLGEIPYLENIIFGYDPQRVLNDVQLTQLDNQDIIAPGGAQETALVNTSRAQYGTLSYWITAYLQGDLYEPYTFGPSLFDLANWIAATNARPTLRMTGLVVDASTNPAAWQFVQSASPGDTITINRRVQTNSNQLISVTGRISQLSRSYAFSPNGQVTGQIAVLVDPMPEANVLVIGDPVRGQLTGTNVLAW